MAEAKAKNITIPGLSSRWSLVPTNPTLEREIAEQSARIHQMHAEIFKINAADCKRQKKPLVKFPVTKVRPVH